MHAIAKKLYGEKGSKDLILFAVRHSQDPQRMYDIIGEIPPAAEKGINDGDEIEGEVDLLSVPIPSGGEMMKAFFIPTKHK